MSEDTATVGAEISLTFQKGLRVLEAYLDGSVSLSSSEIATRTGLNRSVARRLIRTLVQAGYLTEDRGRYAMTVRVLRLTQGFTGGRGLAQVIQPILRLASHDIGDAVSFSMQDETEAVYVAHAFMPSRFTLNRVTVGSRVPLLPTAVGRAILAFLPEDEADRIQTAVPPPLYTEQTETRLPVIRTLLAETRAAGYAYVQSEYVEGVSSLAVPVFRPDGAVVGAVSVIFSQGEHNDQDRSRIVTRLRQCSADVGASF
ncbi:IclR family transcriptional regulator [Pseudoruegeria sp. SK021]|uniref:IclR family transcriptional regulator n=1 Tax=Pseudoruegeria sp. SK021 TaxID=1933035 RepID=UPI000A266A1B|nr:IclR family transcriptional regulator [Pseudoruegeria sp. SK021]OSP55846.1 hypothetical protein BV911_05600 [Pseudoruegeria sp. SK021]